MLIESELILAHSPDVAVVTLAKVLRTSASVQGSQFAISVACLYQSVRHGHLQSCHPAQTKYLVNPAPTACTVLTIARALHAEVLG